MSRAGTVLGTLLLATGAGTGFVAYSAATYPDVNVRFISQLTDTKTLSLSVNGHEMFSDIGPGGKTEYQPVTDSTAKFELRWAGNDSVIASTQFRFTQGTNYTVSANRGMTEQPTLTVVRDQPVKKKGFRRR